MYFPTIKLDDKHDLDTIRNLFIEFANEPQTHFFLCNRIKSIGLAFDIQKTIRPRLTLGSYLRRQGLELDFDRMAFHEHVHAQSRLRLIWLSQILKANGIVSFPQPAAFSTEQRDIVAHMFDTFLTGKPYERFLCLEVSYGPQYACFTDNEACSKMRDMFQAPLFPYHTWDCAIAKEKAHQLLAFASERDRRLLWLADMMIEQGIPFRPRPSHIARRGPDVG